MEQTTNTTAAWSEIKIGAVELKSNTCDVYELELMIKRLIKQKDVKKYIQCIEEKKKMPVPSYIG